MSLYDYNQSKELMGYGFYTCLMAALRNADSTNLEKVKAMWPDVFEEFKDRYNASGGLLEGEIQND